MHRVYLRRGLTLEVAFNQRGPVRRRGYTTQDQGSVEDGCSIQMHDRGHADQCEISSFPLPGFQVQAFRYIATGSGSIGGPSRRL